jgi:inner membrane protein
MIECELDIAPGGTESLALVPLARKRLQARIDWPHPSFGGRFLPGQRQVSGNGFTAEWEVSSLATGAQAQFLAGHTVPSCEAITMPRYGDDRAMAPTSGSIDAVAVSLVDPVNIYSKADRATKYGVLFVVLTFVGFFMFELIRRLPIHPIQYVLVGLALAIFFFC